MKCRPNWLLENYHKLEKLQINREERKTKTITKAKTKMKMQMKMKKESL